MKLKLLVTTMIVAGAVSANAFADDMQAQLTAMQAQIAQMQAAMNANGAGTNLPNDGWANRISVGGMLNVDANAASKYSPVNFTTKHPSNLTVANANLFVDAKVSDWTNAHVGLVYASGNNTPFSYLPAATINNSEATSSDYLTADEAYATIGNFAKSPFYLKAGKQYLPFGSYTPYADMTPSLTQVLSQVDAPSVQTGFVTTSGFNGSLYALDGLNKISGSTAATRTASGSNPAIRNWGASLGINNAFNNVGYNVGVDYLNNMADVAGVSYALTNTASTDTTNGVAGYTKTVNAFAANAGVKYNAFDASAKYVGALQHFSAADLTQGNGSSSKPQAYGVDVGYSFPVLSHDSRFGLGYQGSKQASGMNMFGNGPTTAAANGGFSDYNTMGLPQNRYLATYNVNVSKYTDLGLQVRHDMDYSTGNGGTGHSTNTATARLAVKFA